MSENREFKVGDECYFKDMGDCYFQRVLEVTKAGIIVTRSGRWMADGSPKTKKSAFRTSLMHIDGDRDILTSIYAFQARKRLERMDWKHVDPQLLFEFVDRLDGVISKGEGESIDYPTPAMMSDMNEV